MKNKNREITSEKKQRIEARVNLVKAYAIDIMVLLYSIIISYKIIIIRFIFEQRESVYSGNEVIWIFIISVFGGIIWTTTRMSIGSWIAGIDKKEKRSKIILKFAAWFLFNITFIAGWIVTRISLTDLLSYEGLTGAGRIFASLFTPKFDIFNDALFAMIETIYLALMATLLSVPPAVVLSFLTARNLMKKNFITFTIYSVLRLILNLIRSVESFIWAVIFSVWVGIGPFAGMLALLIHTIAANAKLYSEAVEGIDEGPVEAITSTGANNIQIVWFAIVPQVILPFLSFTIYRWDINVRMATVIGLVGGGGIGTMLIQYQGLAKWQEVGLIIIMIAIVVWVMDYVSAKIRESIY